MKPYNFYKDVFKRSFDSKRFSSVEKIRHKSENVGDTATLTPEWDPNSKESWFFDFEKEPVNDQKWSCVVTTAVQNEAQDEEIIQIYTQCVNTGLRKAVKIISMADVVKLLRGGKKDERNSKQQPKTPTRFLQVVDQAAKYATYSGNECKLPADLMAAVIKYIILTLKDENCLQKRIETAKEEKLREETVKQKFIRDAKPFNSEKVEKKTNSKISPNILELDERINDEPTPGPDLYILLTDFFNVSYFLQLQLINVPFLAIVKVSVRRDPGSPGRTSESLLEMRGRIKSGASLFWKKLKQDCNETTTTFKDVAMLEYEADIKSDNRVDMYRTIFDELTWTQYSAFSIFRQHQKYLRELQVQRLIMCMETLDLSKCELYNNLCDALIIGEPITPLLVLYAMIEQVVVGLPEADIVILEYSKKEVVDVSESDSSVESKSVVPVPLMPPCKKCMDKKPELLKLALPEDQSQISEENEWGETSGGTSQHRTPSLSTRSEENSAPSTPEKIPSGLKIFESLIKRVNERKTEKEMQKDKKWKSPSLCFYGDYVHSQTLHCDCLIDSETIVERFLKNCSLPRIWANYPELPPEEKAFCNFHFQRLLKISNHSEDLLKIKIFFTIAMMMIRKIKSNLNFDLGSTSEKLNVSKLDENFLARLREDKKNFPEYFFRNYIMGTYFRKTGVRKDSVEHFLESINKSDSQSECNSNSKIDPILQTTDSTDTLTEKEKSLGSLYSILDYFEISNLTERSLENETADVLGLIQDFKFYERLQPNLMIQRLIEAEENFNAIKCSYFRPTDTLIILMYNDTNQQGIFDGCESHVISTPVALKDFYEHVYPEIIDWLMDEEAENAKFMAEHAEKLKEREEKKNAKYLAQLKRRYCEMSVEKRKEFMMNEAEVPSKWKITEKDLEELPVKPTPKYSDKISFIATNFTEFRVENTRKIREFYSQDGTRVNVTIDNWLHVPFELLKLTIKRSHLSLYYNQWLGQDLNSDFMFRTDSDMIFAFSKNRSEMDLNYSVSISWPTGLLIRPVWYDFGVYLKQGYLNPYRKGWEIEQEESRCFLKHGKVIVFKEDGDYDILCGSGMKYSFQESMTRYDIITTTGEVKQVRTKGACKNKITQIGTNKIYIGVDPNNKEVFYRREDGVRCMLWPSGKLVTNFPDGTKITTTPYFEEEEVTVYWTEEEILYFMELESKSVQEPRSRTILRNLSNNKSMEKRSFDTTGFVSVSCSYLMEHPKYARVCFSPTDSYIKVTMPEQLSLLIYPEGNYEIQQDRYLLTVNGSNIKFEMKCHSCEDKSTVTINLDSSEILCKCVDFFQKAFYVYCEGDTKYQEYYEEQENEEMGENYKEPEKSGSDISKCRDSHSKNVSFEQRCFALERDLNGVEYLHADSFAFQCNQLPKETYFELNTDDPNNISHTFNSPYHKIGQEKWVMDYEEKNNSLPTNLKKKDLKELGVKQVSKNTFKYPFPKHHNCENQPQNERGKRDINEPKIIMTRTVKCLSSNPHQVIGELQQYVTEYQEKAVAIFNEYKSHKVVDDRSYDSRYVDMRLRKIALTLCQSLQMYPHLCTNLPSTERDIHYFGHFINSMETLKSHIKDDLGILPDCKQIPRRLPTSRTFPRIDEENETQINT